MFGQVTKEQFQMVAALVASIARSDLQQLKVVVYCTYTDLPGSRVLKVGFQSQEELDSILISDPLAAVPSSKQVAIKTFLGRLKWRLPVWAMMPSPTIGKGRCTEVDVYFVHS